MTVEVKVDTIADIFSLTAFRIFVHELENRGTGSSALLKLHWHDIFAFPEPTNPSASP